MPTSLRIRTRFLLSGGTPGNKHTGQQLPLPIKENGDPETAAKNGVTSMQLPLPRKVLSLLTQQQQPNKFAGDFFSGNYLLSTNSVRDLKVAFQSEAAPH
jgi:hypothetical protein